eukprot:8916-Heterococcus_DN1.PRE.4
MSPWKILAAFGYDDTLKLPTPEGLLPPQSNALTSKYYKCDKYNTRQLSHAAWEFLCKTFDLYASKDTGLLTPENELDIFKVLHSPAVAPWHTARLYEYQEIKQCYAVPYQKATAATAAAPAATTAGDTQQGGISSSGSAASIGALNVITEEPDSSNSGNTSSSSSSSTNDNNDSPKSTDPQQQQQQTEGISKLQWLALWQYADVSIAINTNSSTQFASEHNASVLMLVLSAAVALALCAII